MVAARFAFTLALGLVLAHLLLTFGVVRIEPAPPTSWPAVRCRTFYEAQTDSTSAWERIKPLTRC